MITQIDIPIMVGAIFEPQGRIRPVWFMWRGKKHSIKQITYTWSQKKGRNWIQNFAVTDGDNLYQISYCRDSIVWRLIALEDGA